MSLNVLFPYRPSDAPRMATFVVADQLGGQSNPATVTINFNTIDNPPVLDLNGPTSPGNNFTTSYTEGGVPVPVSTLLCILYPL